MVASCVTSHNSLYSRGTTGTPSQWDAQKHKSNTKIPFFLWRVYWGQSPPRDAFLKEIKDAVWNPDKVLMWESFALQCDICIPKSQLLTVPWSPCGCLLPSWVNGGERQEVNRGARRGEERGIQKANISTSAQQSASPSHEPAHPSTRRKRLASPACPAALLWQLRPPRRAAPRPGPATGSPPRAGHRAPRPGLGTGLPASGSPRPAPENGATSLLLPPFPTASATAAPSRTFLRDAAQEFKSPYPALPLGTRHPPNPPPSRGWGFWASASADLDYV